MITIIGLSGRSQMADSKKTALEFLQDLKAERDEIDALIRAVEKKLGHEIAQHVSSPDDQEDDARIFPSVTSMPIGFFHNLSQAAAAEKLLRMNPGQPYTTGQILEAFKNSGMTLNPKNSVQILYTALKRSSKFERVGNKAWGLREWYPEKKKRTTSERVEEIMREEGPISFDKAFAKAGAEKERS